jgi:hypothetical protein
MDREPDFFLSAAGEHSGLASPRACWEKARLTDRVRDNFMLVEIIPPLIGQSYGLGDEDIRHLLLWARYEGESLFPIKDWPCVVSIARILDDSITETLTMGRDQWEGLARGFIFRTLEEANDFAKPYERRRS